MNKKLSSLFFVLALVGSGPVLLAQCADPIDDLDDIHLVALEKEIMDELDDLWNERGFDRYGVYEGDDLEYEILVALKDEGDDCNESIFDYAELEVEMAEIGTSVEAVVAGAIRTAGGQSSYRLESPSSPIVLARSTGDTPSFRFENALALWLMGRNPVKTDTVVSATTRGLAGNIKRRR